MFFALVSILFTIVLDYGNEYMTKEDKNWTSFKNFAPKLNLNHNTYIQLGAFTRLLALAGKETVYVLRHKTVLSYINYWKLRK